MKHVLTVKTRRSETERTPTYTTLTLDTDGCTVDQLVRAFHSQSPVVKLQSIWRKKGIPATASVKLSELAADAYDVPATVDSTEAHINALSADDQIKLLQKKFGLDEKVARELVYGKPKE